MKYVIERFDFLVSFTQALLGISGIICLTQLKSQLDKLTYVILIIVCILYTLEELIDIKRIFQDQSLRNALYRLQTGHPTKRDILLLTKKGILRQDSKDGDDTDNS